MNNPDNDEQFVDELLRQAQGTLGDPRVQFVHVRHAGPGPVMSQNAAPGSDTNAASIDLRTAWTQTTNLAATLRDLWEHAWLPDPPTVAGVRYLDDSGTLRVEVTGHSDTTEQIRTDTAVDRLLVQGFLPDDAHARGRIHARRGTCELVIEATSTDVCVTLSDTLEVTEHTTLDLLTTLPVQVSLISPVR